MMVGIPRNSLLHWGVMSYNNCHAAMKGTSCCNECGAIEYCYFRGDKTKFSDTGIAAAFAISVSIVKCCANMLSVEKNMRI